MKLALSETPKTGFLLKGPYCYSEAINQYLEFVEGKVLCTDCMLVVSIFMVLALLRKSSYDKASILKLKYFDIHFVAAFNIYN